MTTPCNYTSATYSLLLGIDEERKEIACGLVDTIGKLSWQPTLVTTYLRIDPGSYTFAKTLEYKAKQGLHGKAVTVVPPAEYQQRFVNTLEGYFVACPGTESLSIGPLNTVKKYHR